MLRNIENVRPILLVWDRLGIVEAADYTYSDVKLGHSRNLFDYIKFFLWLRNLLRRITFDKVIIFGIPLLYFRIFFLNKKQSKITWCDIRDHHRLASISLLSGLWYFPEYISISSRGYLGWIPDRGNVVVDHNIPAGLCFDIDLKFDLPKFDGQIILSYIGAITDFEACRTVIDKLAGVNNIFLRFDGEGIASESLKKHVEVKNITNVAFSGAYSLDGELSLYLSAIFVNMLFDSSVNRDTCLTNRLYFSVLTCRPVVVYSGSYMAGIVYEYNLGVTVKRDEDLVICLKRYIKEYSATVYLEGRAKFIKMVNSDVRDFNESLIGFCNNEWQ